MKTDREYVPLHLIQSSQQMVYRERVNFYKELMRRGATVDPIELQDGGEFYVLGNGHHRAVAAHEMGEIGIDATLGYPGLILGVLRPIEKIEVLPGDRAGNHLPNIATVLKDTKSHCC